MHAIRTDALTKHYSVGFWRPRPYRALDSLTLEVAPGEVFGFLGPNGAGKTTTLRCLLGLVRPTGGLATIGGLTYPHIPNPIPVVGAALGVWKRPLLPSARVSFDCERR